jgi:hypothetical protein
LAGNSPFEIQSRLAFGFISIVRSEAEIICKSADPFFLHGMRRFREEEMQESLGGSQKHHLPIPKLL